jgi:hypothetical protein
MGGLLPSFFYQMSVLVNRSFFKYLRSKSIITWIRACRAPTDELIRGHWAFVFWKVCSNATVPVHMLKPTK